MEETIQRLSSKPGVTATVVIDRETRTVLQAKGTMNGTSVSSAGGIQFSPNTTSTSTATPEESEASTGGDINEFASLIWNYVNSSAQLVQSLDTEDDLKLLQLRTKKNELIIVPDSKFIFVVVHDAKSA